MKKNGFRLFFRAYNNVRQRRFIMIIMIISYDFFFLPSIFLFDWLQCAVLCTRTSSLRLIHRHTHCLTLNRLHSSNSKILFTHNTYIVASSWILSLSFFPSHSHSSNGTFWSHTFAFYVILKIMKIYSLSPLLLFRPVSYKSYSFFLFHPKEREWAYRKMDEEK